MLITVANQKGGVGKSTIVMLLANWLKECGNDVVVLDADRQNSIYYQRELDKTNFSEQEFGYPISQFSIDKSQQEIADILRKLKETKPDTYILLDAPGNLAENGLVPCLALADVIVCPFIYERKVLDSTGTFIVVLTRIMRAFEAHPKTVFLPNCVRSNTGTKDEKEVYRQVEEVFMQYGDVVPIIKDLQAIKRVNTIELTKEQFNIVDQCFQKIKEICQN